MKVAIMGAGMSGLSCAIVLEQNGIYPTIFESRSRPGDRFINAEAILNVLDRPINNSLDFLRSKYDISLKPLSQISRMTFLSKNNKGELEGNIGWSNIRGRHDLSYETQLAAQIKSEILYNSKITYEELSKEFSHVVLATGDASYAIKLNNYRQDLTVTLKGATVEGSFNPAHLYSWLNYDFAPKGYSYLIPFSDSEAHIVIGFPDNTENKEYNIQNLWEKFYQTACRNVGQDLKITDNFEVNNYIIGICSKPQINNTYFVGNNFGSLMPAFGFGQFTSVLTGVYAAHDICGISSYETSVKPLFKAYDNSLIIRRYMESIDNDKLDKLVQYLNYNLIHLCFGDKLRADFFKLLSYILRPVVKSKRA